MRVEFNKGYICCGCSERFSKRSSYLTYKNSCICNKCYAEFKISSKSFVFQGTKETDFVISPFEYDGIYREIFLKFKFNGDLAAGNLIGMLLEEYFNDITQIRDFDSVIPVPLSKQRLCERGYNQTEILLSYVSKAVGLPVNSILNRTKHSMAQSSLTGQSRVENVKGVFSTEGDLSGKNVLLFDDVITTGSTVNECARVLKAAGAESVGVLSSARVNRHEEKVRIY